MLQFGVKFLAACLVLGAITSELYAASVEPLYTEISKLPPEARQKRLEEGARREGALTYYSISQTDLIAAYIKGFTTRYPFIKGDFYRGSGNQLVVRTMMEHKSGRLVADVISVGTENVMALKRSGIWTRYRSPEAQFYPREQYDKDGFFHSDSLGLATMAYNSLLVKKEEAPKSYSDLLDPKWKGSLTIDLEPERAMLAWLSAWGEAKTREFVQKTSCQRHDRAPRPYAARATAVRRRIQNCRRSLSGRHVAHETERLSGGDRVSQSDACAGRRQFWHPRERAAPACGGAVH